MRPTCKSPADLTTGGCGPLTLRSGRADSHFQGEEKKEQGLRLRAHGRMSLLAPWRALTVVCRGLRLVGRQGRGATFLHTVRLNPRTAKDDTRQHSVVLANSVHLRYPCKNDARGQRITDPPRSPGYYGNAQLAQPRATSIGGGQMSRRLPYRRWSALIGIVRARDNLSLVKSGIDAPCQTLEDSLLVASDGSSIVPCTSSESVNSLKRHHRAPS